MISKKAKFLLYGHFMIIITVVIFIYLKEYTSIHGEFVYLGNF